MDSKDRRKKIVEILLAASKPVSGSSLSRQVGVSRQIVVQDIALLRVEGNNILSTNSGYILQTSTTCERVFKVQHSEAEVSKELSLIVDLGGKVKDVFVYHKVYGVLRADMPISSRRDILNFEKDIASGKSSLLMNVTSGFHYHTVTADSEEILNEIQEALQSEGFLAKLQDYEPVNFWEDEK